MLYRAKAPLRLGFAGGGTDLSPYCDTYGGAVLNACVSMYANATIEPRNDDKIVFNAFDMGISSSHELSEELELDGQLDLVKGVYNYLTKEFNLDPMSLTLSTYVDAPAASGLGSSSTLIVAIIKAFAEWQKLPLGEYDLANLAYTIERVYLKQAGGKQDQYAAAFGGFNFMEFYDDRTIVNPLRINNTTINELCHNSVLFFTGIRRESARIIEKQIESTEKSTSSLEATHKLKEQAIAMKEALLKNEIDKIGNILHEGWQNKKAAMGEVSNSFIDDVYNTAVNAGATGGKVSGAGGGGFMMFYCPNITKYKVIEELSKLGTTKNFKFVKNGAQAWSIR